METEVSLVSLESPTYICRLLSPLSSPPWLTRASTLEKKRGPQKGMQFGPPVAGLKLRPLKQDNQIASNADETGASSSVAGVLADEGI